MRTKYTTKIDNLLALCHIIDNYKEFEQRLITILQNQKNNDFIFRLWDLSQGKKFLTGKKAKKFYEENKEILDTINKYTNIYRFINHYYNKEGKPNKNILFFYNYLSTNKKQLNQIINLLEELQKLDFDEFTFDTKLNVNDETHTILTNFNANMKISYVANPIVIPTYENKIHYKSNNSNYKMDLNVLTNKLSINGKKLTVNSLLFNINTLPLAIDKEHIFDPLLETKLKQLNASSLIKNSVDLNISIEDLENQLTITENIINNIDNIKSKKELLNILINIKNEINILKAHSNAYNNDIIEEEKTLTTQILNKEKRLYLNRREILQKYW